MTSFTLLWGQDKTSADYAEQYSRQVSMTGMAGVGVQTILDNWAKAYPDEPSVYEGYFLYYWTKSQDNRIVIKPIKKFLGNKPVFQAADSLGEMKYFFEETFFDDENFGLATKYIDKAIELAGENLNFRCEKILALIEYEKESPDMAKMEVNSMIDDYQTHPQWTFDGEKVNDDVFADVVQDYIAVFIRIASPQSFAAALEIASRMNKLFPKRTVFLTDIASYHTLCTKDYKKATKYLKNALKIDPADESARNILTNVEKLSAAKKASRTRK